MQVYRYPLVSYGNMLGVLGIFLGRMAYCFQYRLFALFAPGKLAERQGRNATGLMDYPMSAGLPVHDVQ